MRIENTSVLPQQYSSNSASEGPKIQEVQLVAEQEPSLGEKHFIQAIEKANQGLKKTNTSLKFSIHEGTKQILVKIIDNDTKETVKEIPPEKILDMVAAMLEKTGLFVDEKI